MFSLFYKTDLLHSVCTHHNVFIDTCYRIYFHDIVTHLPGKLLYAASHEYTALLTVLHDHLSAAELDIAVFSLKILGHHHLPSGVIQAEFIAFFPLVPEH